MPQSTVKHAGKKTKKQRKKTKVIIAHLATERSLMQSGPSSRPYVDVESDSQQLLDYPEILTWNFVFGDKGTELHNKASKRCRT